VFAQPVATTAAGGHEQLISNSVRFKPAFVKRDEKQTMIDLRGISTNWFKNQSQYVKAVGAQSAAVASGRASTFYFFRSATLRTVSNSYLVNLALSDILLSTLACPITLGNSMAKICSYVVLRKGDLFRLHFFNFNLR
jgi:hypothetical protein